MKLRRDKIISFRVTASQWTVLCEQAEREFLTPSELIRFGVAEYLARRGVDIVAYRGATRGPWPPSYKEGGPEHIDSPAA